MKAVRELAIEPAAASIQTLLRFASQLERLADNSEADRGAAGRNVLPRTRKSI